jgi:transcriptional regulator with PAS, ATPase and Fis domain
LSLFSLAIEDAAGPALLLDADLRIVHVTPGAERLLGESVPLGVLAPKALCGAAVDRPIAEALAAGRAVTGLVHRPVAGGGERVLRVRANPLLGARDERVGWLLLVDEERREEGDARAPVLFHGMWTMDPSMKRVFHVIERAARRDASVLVRGETGSGKELVARAIHALSPRAKGPFVAINCSALPATLLESELFGHVKGAFTGAVRDNVGLFRAANKGTIFLDEIAEVPVELQAKLLRVLETRTVLPVGGREAIAVDVRVVAATHQSLRTAVERGTFRADLMYRLRVVPIFLPPLRMRSGDVGLVAQRLIEELNEGGGRRVARLAPGALAAMQRYPWPGNIRELRNALEYAYVVGEGPVLNEGELPAEIVDPGLAGDGAGIVVSAPPAPAPEDPTKSPEVQRIERALERVGGNRERAAQVLGMSRVTLWRRMKALGMADESAAASGVSPRSSVMFHWRGRR